MEENKVRPILLVMAAGMGSRYGGMKQIDPVGDQGEIILDFSLYDAMLAGFERVVFVIREEFEKEFREIIDERAGKYLEVEYAFQKKDDLPEGYDVPEERKKPWGTAHAVYSAREYIDAPFCVINADDYYGPLAFMNMYEYLSEDPEDFAMVAFRLGNTLTENGHVARGICEVTDDGMLDTVTERTMIEWKEIDGIRTPAFSEDKGDTWTGLPEDTPVSMNFWGFRADFIDAIGERFSDFLDRALVEDPEGSEFFLPFVVSDMIKAGETRVKVLTSSDKWYGVTYKKDREQVVDALQSMKDKGFYPDKLFK